MKSTAASKLRQIPNSQLRNLKLMFDHRVYIKFPQIYQLRSHLRKENYDVCGHNSPDRRRKPSVFREVEA